MHSDSRRFVAAPYMLEQVAERGSVAQRAWARHELQRDQVRIVRRAARQAAGSASILARRPGGTHERTIYDSHRSHDDPPHGRRVRFEGWPAIGDEQANSVYDALGATSDLFWHEYGRNSIDDAGMALHAYVHFGVSYGNAFWDGQELLVGDGDGTIIGRLAHCVDVIGHELTHGVVARTAKLDYRGQAGSLQESICDVFGSLVKQRVRDHTAVEADWLIGEGVLARGINGSALRSLRAPGTAYDDPLIGADPQPAHVSELVTSGADGGVHVNAGIPNHAFYLASVKIGGHPWEHSGRIWYETLTDKELERDADFARFAELTLANARRLYGDGAREVDAVGEAWHAVGVLDASPLSLRAGCSTDAAGEP
jgi:Zn-dependent metalloprotease